MTSIPESTTSPPRRRDRGRRSVVVGLVDEQPVALRLAVGEAVRSGSSLRVLHPGGRGGAAVPALVEEARRVVADEAPGLDVAYAPMQGGILQALEHEALEARVLVVGSDVAPWFGRFLRSHIATALVARSPCPVLVVPETHAATRERGAVVLAVDLWAPAGAAVRFAHEAAEARGCVLHVLHVATPAAFAADVTALRVEAASLATRWRRTFPAVPVLRGFAIGDVEDAIVRASRTAALVVLGRRDGGAACGDAPPDGLVTEVVDRAHCPVAVVPDERRG